MSVQTFPDVDVVRGINPSNVRQAQRLIRLGRPTSIHHDGFFSLEEAWMRCVEAPRADPLVCSWEEFQTALRKEGYEQCDGWWHLHRRPKFVQR